MPKKVEILPGAVFGRWVVLGEDPTRRNYMVEYFVKCECGKESSVVGRELRIGRSNGCQSCCDKDKQKFASGKHVHGTYFNAVLHNARKRNICFDLKVEDMDQQWELQSGLCALTGWELSLRTKKVDTSRTASLDRIDSNIGYSPDNIQWVHKDVNKMKLDIPEPYFFTLCKAVYLNKEETKKLRGSRPWMK